jgi:archaemetzincin
MSFLTLRPLGAPPEEVLERVEAQLLRTFGLDIRRAAPQGEPEHALDATRGQWSSTEILKLLLTQAPPEPARLLGITERDLFVPVLSFVYGQAQLRGRVAVISLARLRAEFYGLPGDPQILATRAAKEAVHEVGHLFGLVHCPDRRCPLSLSIGLEDLDFKTAEPCASCSALLTGSLDMVRARAQAAETRGAR